MKIFLLIVILFCKTYGATLENLKEYEGKIFSFMQCVGIFAGNFLEVREPENIPYAALDINHINCLKLAFIGQDYNQPIPVNFSKIQQNTAQDLNRVNLQDTLRIMSNNNQFSSQALATDCLTNMRIALSPKPHTADAISQWQQNWINSMQLLSQLKQEIWKQLAPYEHNYRILSTH